MHFHKLASEMPKMFLNLWLQKKLFSWMSLKWKTLVLELRCFWCFVFITSMETRENQETKCFLVFSWGPGLDRIYIYIYSYIPFCPPTSRNSWPAPCQTEVISFFFCLFFLFLCRIKLLQRLSLNKKVSEGWNRKTAYCWSRFEHLTSPHHGRLLPFLFVFQSARC